MLAPRRALSVLALLLVCSVSASALDPAAQLRFADGLYSRDMFEAAALEYQVLVREASDFAQLDAVYYRLAECYRRLGQPAPAEIFYRRCLQEFPDSAFRPRAAYRHAELKVRDGNYLEAVSRLRTFLEENPPAEFAASARYYLGYSLKRLQVTGDARDALRTVLESHPDSPFAAYAALELADLAGKDEAAQLLARAVELAPTPRLRAEALFRQADAAYRQNAFETAAGLYRELLETAPDDFRADEAALQAAWSLIKAERDPAQVLPLAARNLPGATGEARVQWLYLQANAHRLTGAMEAAASTYATLLGETPDHSLALPAALEAARTASAREDFAGVLELFEGRSLPPAQRPEALWLRAEAARRLDRTALARDLYDSLWRDHSDAPQTPAAGLHLAGLLADADPREGADQYRAFAERLPTHPQAADALRQAGSLYREAEDPEAAAGAWEAFLEGYPDAPGRLDTGLQRALTLIRLDRLGTADQALAALREEAGDDPLRATIAYWQGVLSDRRDHTVKAARLLREALDADPDPELEARIQYRLSAVLLRRGEPGAAAGLLLELLEAGRTTGLPPDLLEWLARYQLEQEAPASAVLAARTLLDETADPAWIAIGGWLLGQGLEALGQTGQAIAAYRRALPDGAEPQRESLLARLALAALLVSAGDRDEAGRHIEAVVEAAVPETWSDLRARGLLQLGDWQAGGGDWATAARTWMSLAVLYDDPERSPEALYRAATAYEQLGQARRLQSTLEELRARYPDSPWARRSLPGAESAPPESDA